jgi:hypothetical protein
MLCFKFLKDQRDTVKIAPDRNMSANGIEKENESTIEKDTDPRHDGVNTDRMDTSPIDVFESKVKNIIRSSYTMVGIALGRELGWLGEMSTGESFTADQLAVETQCKAR